MECYQGRVTPQPSLRNRLEIDNELTDRNIFSNLPLGDCWIDSGLHKAWKYIYANKYLRIPESWAECIRAFDEELTARVHRLQV